VSSLANNDESAYPRDWDWKTEGNVAAGAYVKTTAGATVHGQAAIMTLSIGGEDRAIWVFWAALKSKLAQELARRGATDFRPGERIVITRFSMRKSKLNPTQTTVPFTVEFPDEPAATAAGILGVPPSEPPAEAELPADDSIPF
jgi:hypothetical protein